MASYQYVYVMQGLSKAYGSGKKVLENITLSFLLGNYNPEKRIRKKPPGTYQLL